MQQQFLALLKEFSESEKGQLNRSLVREFGALIYRIHQDRETEKAVEEIVKVSQQPPVGEVVGKKRWEVFTREKESGGGDDKKKMVAYQPSRPAAVNSVNIPTTTNINLDGKVNQDPPPVIEGNAVLGKWNITADKCSAYARYTVEEFEEEIGGWEKMKELAGDLGLAKKGSKIQLFVSIHKAISDVYSKDPE